MPDIVATAKATGNGHPIGAVVCRRRDRRAPSAAAPASSPRPAAARSPAGRHRGARRDRATRACRQRAATVGAHLEAGLEGLAERHPADRRGQRPRPLPRRRHGRRPRHQGPAPAEAARDLRAHARASASSSSRPATTATSSRSSRRCASGPRRRTTSWRCWTGSSTSASGSPERLSRCPRSIHLGRIPSCTTALQWSDNRRHRSQLTTPSGTARRICPRCWARSWSSSAATEPSSRPPTAARLLDATAQLWHANIGHGRERLADAARRADAGARDLPHVRAPSANLPAMQLADRVARLRRRSTNAKVVLGQRRLGRRRHRRQARPPPAGSTKGEAEQADHHQPRERLPRAARLRDQPGRDSLQPRGLRLGVADSRDGPRPDQRRRGAGGDDPAARRRPGRRLLRRAGASAPAA